MSGLQVFVDYYSQPCRAILMLMDASKIPYKTRLIKVAQGENRSEEFKKINPNCKVPVVDDEGFRLFESGTIMRYLVQQYKLSDHWYPSDLQRRSKVDEYLDWHQGNLRMGATFFEKYMKPLMLGTEPNQEKLKEVTDIHMKSTKMMESYFLKETKFISSDTISIADIQAVCEYTQFWAADLEPFQDTPRLAQWLEDCKGELQPHFDASHKMIYIARQRGIFKGNLYNSGLLYQT